MQAVILSARDVLALGHDPLKGLRFAKAVAVPWAPCLALLWVLACFEAVTCNGHIVNVWSNARMDSCLLHRRFSPRSLL